MALSESAGQRPALLRPAQGRDDRAYWHELFGSLEVVHFFLVTARCGCFMQAARSLDVKPTLLRRPWPGSRSASACICSCMRATPSR